MQRSKIQKYPENHSLDKSISRPAVLIYIDYGILFVAEIRFFTLFILSHKLCFLLIFEVDKTNTYTVLVKYIIIFFQSIYNTLG
jgi:hypothetical protein